MLPLAYELRLPSEVNPVTQESFDYCFDSALDPELAVRELQFAQSFATLDRHVNGQSGGLGPFDCREPGRYAVVVVSRLNPV